MGDQGTKSELDSVMLRRLGRLIFLARSIVLWERLWPRLWSFLISISFFIICILFDLFRFLPASLHLLSLGGFVLLMLVTLVYALRDIHFPTKQDGVYRLEQDSGLKNQPLSVLLDRPADLEKNKLSQAIWIHHQDRMTAEMKHIQLKIPQSHLWKKDPYSFRAVLIILLVLGGIEARFDYQDRFMRTLFPSPIDQTSQSWKIQAWITPPDHTGLNPILLKADATTDTQKDAITIIQHSRLLLRLEGRPSREEIQLSIGPFNDKFENLGKGIFSLETHVEQGESILISKDNEPVYNWPIQIQADMPPQITLKKPSRSGFRGDFKINYQASDDFGLKQAKLIIRSLKNDKDKTINIESQLNELEANSSFHQNLSEHPWAGTEVIITPQVIDNADQAAYGAALRFTLPERVFNHPLAKRLITIRTSLYEPQLDNQIYARLELEKILSPSKKFQHGIPVYFSLRVAADRLHQGINSNDIANIQTILWQTAVHIDEGAAGSARNQLEFMSRQMQDLMKQAQDKAGMEALFEQMRQSLNNYIQQMSTDTKRIKELENALNPDNVDTVSQDELMNLLERARDLMRAGNVKAAQQMMEQFQSILSRMAMQKPTDAKQSKEAQDIMQQLQSIQQDQQNLLDETFKRSRKQSKPSIESTKKAVLQTEEQKRLLQKLRAQMKRLQDLDTAVPNELTEAERAMSQAAQALQRGLDENAVQAQMRAVETLQEGLKNSASALAQKMGMPSMSRQIPGYDPLGRGLPGRLETPDGQTVPSEAEMHNVLGFF